MAFGNVALTLRREVSFEFGEKCSKKNTPSLTLPALKSFPLAEQEGYGECKAFLSAERESYEEEVYPVTAATTSVRVELGPRSYDIEIGSGNLSSLGGFIAARRRLTHAVVIADAALESFYVPAVTASLEAVGGRVDLFTVKSGEASKCVAEAERLWNALLAVKADRKTIVVALGGGVIGDLAGFVAASFARGLAFIQVPTTLLAHVDSSVGGKTGINLPAAKNIVGAFWQPSGVLIDTKTLKTLPEREYRAGLAEVVKYGVILDADFFVYLEQNIGGLNARDAAVLGKVIARSCRLKADVVERDEREETGLRAVLNYGHTFAHALETVAGYGALLHGEAVAIGMMCAARLAAELGRIDAGLVARQRALLGALKLPVALPACDEDRLLASMQLDKKVEHGNLRFVLPSRLGHVELVGEVSSRLVRKVLREP